MRASIWVFVAVIACTIPLAIGILTEQDWTPYVTFAGWGVIAVGAVVRGIRRSRRAPDRGNAPRGTGVVQVGDVYNDLYGGKPQTEVRFDPLSDVVAEQPVNRRDELADGTITLDLPAQTTS